MKGTAMKILKNLILIFTLLYSTPSFSKIWDVEISNYSFMPSELTINVGDVVRWTNRDDMSHTATSNNLLFNSGLISTNSSFQHTFTTTGTFDYHCSPHPFMTGRIIVTSIAGVNDQRDISKFRLYQNYPNPFNPITVIAYTLPAKNHVKISLYSIIGKEIKTLKNETQEEGYHEVMVDGSNLSSGTYVYKIVVGDQNSIVESRKLTLLK
jgi:plastocyanin